MKTFKIHTLGCRTNKYESQVYFDQLTALGLVYNDISADIHIVNTCFVTKGAEKASMAKVKEILNGEVETVVVTGCGGSLFNDYPDSRVMVVPNLEKEKLVSIIFPDIKKVPSFKIKRFVGQTRAFVKVQDGCDNFCTYCIIPFVRGRSRSRDFHDIIKEVEDLVAAGYKEIVLTGINIGDYNDSGRGLAELVEALDEVRGLKRIRLSSIDPNKVGNRLKNIILNGKNTCLSMHISLQSGSDRILKRMNRKYKKEDFLSLVVELKNKNPDFTFTTDVIVGFPGESEADFEGTLAVIKNVGFAKTHVFPYSKREGTIAAGFSQVPKETVKNRKDILIKQAEKAAFDLRQKYIGKNLYVLLESFAEDSNLILGHTDNFLKVALENNGEARNEMIKVNIVDNNDKCLIGRKE